MQGDLAVKSQVRGERGLHLQGKVFHGDGLELLVDLVVC